MELKQDLEQKEKEQSPILFIYRDNDLYHEHMPDVTKDLQSWGRKVEMQIFPQGTGEEDIAKWIRDNDDLIFKKEVVTDRTVDRQINYKHKRILEEKGVVFKDDLDYIFNGAAGLVIEGDELRELFDKNVERGTEEEHKKEKLIAAKGIERIIRRILEKKENEPERVYILKKKILDHEPFVTEYLLESEKTGKDFIEIKRALKDKDFQAAAELVRTWVAGGGVPENKIEIIEDATPDLVSNMQSSKSWVILDRHHVKNSLTNVCITKSDIRIPRNENCRIFLLPFGNFYSTARDQGLLNVSPEELKQALNQTFKNIFSKEARDE